MSYLSVTVVVLGICGVCGITKMRVINTPVEFKSTPRNQPFQSVTSLEAPLQLGPIGSKNKTKSYFACHLTAIINLFAAVVIPIRCFQKRNSNPLQWQMALCVVGSQERHPRMPESVCPGLRDS